MKVFLPATRSVRLRVIHRAGLSVGLGAVFCYDWRQLRQERHALVLAHRMVRLRSGLGLGSR